MTAVANLQLQAPGNSLNCKLNSIQVASFSDFEMFVKHEHFNRTPALTEIKMVSVTLGSNARCATTLTSVRDAFIHARLTSTALTG